MLACPHRVRTCVSVCVNAFSATFFLTFKRVVFDSTQPTENVILTLMLRGSQADSLEGAKFRVCFGLLWQRVSLGLSSIGQPENCSAGGGGGGDMDARRRRGGGGLEKWGSVSGPLFCVRTDVGAKGTGTQNLARKIFSTNNPPPPHI